MKTLSFIIPLLTAILYSSAQKGYVSEVWVADNKDGTYKNPILHSDYSDPDVIRVGDDYYMTASSFEAIPGLPILHSKDLVNWTIIGAALKRQPPFEHFSKPRHGEGVWAPAIRFHKGEFYIYYPDPDFGIYRITAKNPAGPWTEPILVAGGKGLIDPCPFWDDDGKAYLTHAFAGSRAGIKSIIIIKQMNVEGSKVLDDGIIVYDGHDLDPTIEGPKVYKRNGWYYLFAPAGGVSTGWQTVLRSKSIYGPFERRVVVDQGSTPVNGPHQGAWIDTKTGEHWFIHFQDKGAYGRIAHLQPMKWLNDWPVIGIDKDADGKGEPVLVHKKPNVGKSYPIVTPDESDEFNDHQLGLQWQWQANPQPYWAIATGKTLRLYSYQIPDSAKSYWDVPNILMQKFPAEEFKTTTRLVFKPRLDGERAGMVIMGMDYAYLSLVKRADGTFITYNTCSKADQGNRETEKIIGKAEGDAMYMRIEVSKGAKCKFSYSTDGTNFKDINESFVARPGKWIGAKIGLFCTRTVVTNDSGFADIDWFRVHL